MRKGMDLHKVIYHILVTQIQFGTYHFGERLPNMEEIGQLLLVSLDPIRSAYRNLRLDGFISVSKNVGAKVKIRYTEEEIGQNIQTFFAQRKDALLDLGQSRRLLFGRAQFMGFKNAPESKLDEMEHLAGQKDLLPSYAMIQHFQRIYGSLNNDLLMRLIWQSFMFFQAPFLSIAGNLSYLELGDSPLLEVTGLCRKKDWAALWDTLEFYQEQFSGALARFYEEKITLPPARPQVSFTWSGYKKASQICYSLGKELLGAISRGEYPVGSTLPSQEKLAEEKQVSVSTIRRTLAVLNQIGATKSVNGIGTEILPLDKSTENCDFSQPVVRKRLLDFAQSLQILALSCRASAESTLSSMDAAALGRWKERLYEIKRIERYDMVVYASLDLVARQAPYQAVRTVYGELLQLLFWGHPLRGVRGVGEGFHDFYLPHLDYLTACLERGDAAGYGARLEELVNYELDLAVRKLTRLDIEEAAGLVLPGNEKSV